MRTLDEAWTWYLNARRLLRLIRRIGDRYWPSLPWAEMERDENFKALEGEDVARDAAEVLKEFDDVAVFVLFSVFEAMVRDHVGQGVIAEAAEIKHPALARAARELQGSIEEGSFYKNVLDLYKDLDHDLVERVSQVRAYRNWVAHGRRPGRRVVNISPRVAYDRLGEFLAFVGHRPPMTAE